MAQTLPHSKSTVIAIKMNKGITKKKIIKKREQLQLYCKVGRFLIMTQVVTAVILSNY